MENIETNINGIPPKNERQPFVRLDDSLLHGGSSSFYEVPGHPDMVVRKSFVQTSFKEDDNLKDKYANIQDEDERRKKIIHEKVELLRNKTIQFKKIIDNLGIHMAKTDYVIGESVGTGGPTIFGVTEKIEGENLEKVKKLDTETAEKIDDIYAKIIGAFIDSFLKEEQGWQDLKIEQFVYGKTQEDKKPDVYLVDVDPIFIDWNDPQFQMKYGATRKEYFWRKMERFVFDVGWLEKKVSVDGKDRFNFAKSREMIGRANREVPKL